MATYVNLSVNQGLINKAKVVQAQNRKAAGEKQSAQAKKKPAAAQDPGKKFGTEYQRRKVGASQDDISIGFIRAECTYNIKQQFDTISGRIDPDRLLTLTTLTDTGLTLENVLYSRTYYCADGSVSAQFDMSPLLSMPRRSYPNQSDPNAGSNEAYMREVVLPAGEDKCVLLVGMQTNEIVSSSPRVNRFATYVTSYFVTNTSIREISTPPRLESMFGSNTVAQLAGTGIFAIPQILPIGQGWYGWNNDVYATDMPWAAYLVDPYIGHNYSPDVFDGINRHLDSLDRDPSKGLWYLGINAERDIIITESNRNDLAPGRSIADDNEAHMAWVTADGSFPEAINPYILTRLQSPIATNRLDGADYAPAKDILLNVENTTQAQQHPNVRWGGKFVTIPQEQTTPDIMAKGGASTYELGRVGVFYDEFTLMVNAVSEAANIPPPADQSVYIGFTDWGAPDYCIEQLIALGYDPEDLS